MGFYMRLGNHRWLYLFLIFLSPNAFSLAYYITPVHNPPTTQFPSMQSACDAATKQTWPNRFSDFLVTSSTTFTCRTRDVLGGQVKSTFSGTIHGTCDATHPFDPVIGGCKLSKCESLSGTSRPFSKSGTAPDTYAFITSGRLGTVQSACFDTCVASTVDQKCTAKTSGSYSCRGTAWFTGAECGSADTSTVDETEDTTRPEPQDIKNEEPCNYTTLPDGTQSCKSLSNSEKEGQSCGTFNGVQTCIDKNPTQNKVEIDTKVSTETTSDGKTKITKTDTATITKCKGINDCKTETTVNKTVVVKNPQGQTESTSGTCTGSACPNSNGNPDANGDGLGDCSTGDCGDGEGEGEGEGEDGGGWYEGTDDTFASVLQSFSDDVSNIPMVSGIRNFLTFSPGGSCPAGYVNAWVFSIELNQWCTDTIPWALIASVVMAAAAFLSYRIAFT